MKIPKSVKIGGITYTVELSPYTNNGDKMLLGQIEYDKALIKLNTELQEKQNMKVTLLHEIIHGILKHFRLDGINDDEDTVNKLADGFYMVIADNPEIFKG